MAVGTTRRVVDWWGDGEGEGEGEGLVSGLVQIANCGRSGAIMQSIIHAEDRHHRQSTEQSSGVSQGLTAENSIVFFFSVLFCSCRSILVPTRANEQSREPKTTLVLQALVCQSVPIPKGHLVHGGGCPLAVWCPLVPSLASLATLPSLPSLSSGALLALRCPPCPPCPLCPLCPPCPLVPSGTLFAHYAHYAHYALLAHSALLALSPQPAGACSSSCSGSQLQASRPSLPRRLSRLPRHQTLV